MSIEEQIEESERKRRSAEQLKQQIQAGGGNIAAVEFMAQTLPFFSDGKSLEAAGRVLQLIKDKLRQEQELHLFVERFENDMGELAGNLSVLPKVREQNETITAQLSEVIALLKQYVADNKQAVDGINRYLKDWAR